MRFGELSPKTEIDTVCGFRQKCPKPKASAGGCDKKEFGLGKVNGRLQQWPQSVNLDAVLFRSKVNISLQIGEFWGFTATFGKIVANRCKRCRKVAKVSRSCKSCKKVTRKTQKLQESCKSLTKLQKLQESDTKDAKAAGKLQKSHEVAKVARK
jgi:hypothetical protein